jgi:hypothetical protein
METIKLEQAVFASSDRGRMKGYQLVSKSPGVDRESSQELCRWAPTQIPSDNPANWTINYFPISDETVAVTRTVLGGPEYSGRGGTQVVTLILLLTNEQFDSYSYNPIVVAKTAMAMGYLKLPMDMACEQLPLAELPTIPLVDPWNSRDEREQDSYRQLLDEVTELLMDSRRVAVVGLQKPIDAVERLVPRLTPEARRNFSFTTGLSPAVRRPFQAHFLSDSDVTKKRTLDAQSIIRVTAK